MSGDQQFSVEQVKQMRSDLGKVSMNDQASLAKFRNKYAAPHHLTLEAFVSSHEQRCGIKAPESVEESTEETGDGKKGKKPQ